MQSLYVVNKQGSLHQLSASLKLILAGLMILSIILSTNLYVLLVNTIFVFTGSLLYGKGTLLKRIKPFFFLAVFITIFHTVLNPANITPIIGIFYWEGFYYGLKISLRLMGILAIMHIYLISTHPEEIFQMFYKWNPYLGMIMMLLLGIIPVMKQEMEQTKIAQQVRGLNWGTMFQKFKAYLILLIPVVIKSLYRAQSMADLLYLRGFNPGGSRQNQQKEKRTWTKKDKAYFYGALGYSILFGLLFILL